MPPTTNWPLDALLTFQMDFVPVIVTSPLDPELLTRLDADG